MTQTVKVALGAGRRYDVLIGSGLLDQAGVHIAPRLRRPRVAVVMDEVVASLHGAALLGVLGASGIDAPAIIIPPGEAAKSFAGLADLCDRLLALGLERSDMIVAFGGGVVGDLAGFAAAIYKRGVDFIQIPTTLLAMVDSSVGGKTAIDTPRGKNLIGAFHQPRLVLADLDVLATLPDREMICGHAEILKYGLLGDAAFFDWLAAHTPEVLARQPTALSHAVRRCVEMKAALVARDEREGGARALLNLGHTFGHAIEAEMGFGEAMKHGEAVGLGCALALRFSVTLGLCDAGAAHRAVDVLARAGLPTRLTNAAGPQLRPDALMAHMRQDKKASGGALTLVLLRAIGDALVVDNVDPSTLRAFLLEEGAAA